MAQNVTDTSPVTKMSQNKLTLPPECFACGEETEWKLTSGKKETMEVKGESLQVPTSSYCCTKCHYELMTPAQLKTDTLTAIAMYQRKHGLLTAAEVKERRKALKMSQPRFCVLAKGVEEASLKRLEAGQRVQNESTDVAIRTALDTLEAQQKSFEVICFAAAKVELRSQSWGKSPALKSVGLAAGLILTATNPLTMPIRHKFESDGCLSTQHSDCMNFDMEAQSC